MPEINPLSNEQIFLKKIAENTGSDYNTGDVSEINPLTIDQILLKEIAANTAGQSGDITELEEKVTANAEAIEAMVNVNGCCNVFDLDNPIEINGFSKTGTTLTNTHTDTKDFFEFMLWSWVGNTPSALIFGTNITSNGHKVFDVTIPSNYDKLQFGHNGASRDLWVMVSNVPAGDYKISFDVTGHNPSVVGGLEISNIMLYDARLTPTGYVPYAMTNAELTKSKANNDIVSVLSTIVSRGYVDYVGVVSDGVKTYGQLLSDLFTTEVRLLVINHRLTARIVIGDSLIAPYVGRNMGDNKVFFGNANWESGSGANIGGVMLDNTSLSNCKWTYTDMNGTVNDLSDLVPGSGVHIGIYY